jgi:L-2-hydroxyglutarate oxidase
MLTYPGLLSVLRKNCKSSLMEMKNSFYKKGYLELVRKYSPGLDVEDLHDYPAGIRAQAVSRDWQLINDFLFVNTKRALAVSNAPSPAATSAIPIGKHIVNKLKALAGI